MCGGARLRTGVHGQPRQQCASVVRVRRLVTRTACWCLREAWWWCERLSAPCTAMHSHASGARAWQSWCLALHPMHAVPHAGVARLAGAQVLGLHVHAHEVVGAPVLRHEAVWVKLAPVSRALTRGDAAQSLSGCSDFKILKGWRSGPSLMHAMVGTPKARVGDGTRGA